MFAGTESAGRQRQDTPSATTNWPVYLRQNRMALMYDV